MNARYIFFIAVSLCIIFVGNDCFAADTINSDIIAQVVKSFADKTENWTNIAVKYARLLFYWCAVLQLGLLGYEVALGGADIGTTFKKLCMAVLTGGFFFAVITHYSEWSRNIINGMMSIAGEMGGIENSSDNAFKMGIELCSEIWANIATLSFVKNAALIFGMVIALFITIICFCLITAQVIFIKCEAFVAMLAACILLGFGTLSIMRDYAVNVLRYILAVAFKLFVMQLVIGIGYSFLKEAVTPQADLPSVCVIIGASIVLLALVKSLPDTVAGIIQGSHIGSGVA
ncbi:P-type conjugative transfer protein TrbL, partial [Desulfovibrio piger]|nr:P-type conjugative transfer protein TrbL [Desulfovibrio piger]